MDKYPTFRADEDNLPFLSSSGFFVRIFCFPTMGHHFLKTCCFVKPGDYLIAQSCPAELSKIYSLSQIPSFPVIERYDTEAKISNFSSLIWFPNTLFFIRAFQNATFGVKNTAVSQKLSKLASILVYFLPLLAQM